MLARRGQSGNDTLVIVGVRRILFAHSVLIPLLQTGRLLYYDPWPPLVPRGRDCMLIGISTFGAGEYFEPRLVFCCLAHKDHRIGMLASCGAGISKS